MDSFGSVKQLVKHDWDLCAQVVPLLVSIGLSSQQFVNGLNYNRRNMYDHI